MKIFPVPEKIYNYYCQKKMDSTNLMNFYEVILKKF